jgi:hypothetical protein
MPHKLYAIYSRLIEDAIKAGDDYAARRLAQAAADYRKGETREIEHCEGDWTDRCGW